MLSLKATLKAIGESITTIKTALDGKATKYTGYGTKVSLSLSTTSWYTFPSDGILQIYMTYEDKKYVYLTLQNSDGSSAGSLHAGSTPAWSTWNTMVFKGQKVQLSRQNTTDRDILFFPFV